MQRRNVHMVAASKKFVNPTSSDTEPPKGASLVLRSYALATISMILPGCVKLSFVLHMFYYSVRLARANSSWSLYLASRRD